MNRWVQVDQGHLLAMERELKRHRSLMGDLSHFGTERVVRRPKLRVTIAGWLARQGLINPLIGGAS